VRDTGDMTKTKTRKGARSLDHC